MNFDNNHIDPYELIGKYLSRQAGQEEISRLEDWVKENPKNEKLFREIKSLWRQSGVIKSDLQINAETEWKNLESKLFGNENIVKQLYEPTAKWKFRAILRYAAIFIVSIALSGILYIVLSRPKMNELTASINVETKLLPDGSEVTLNVGSTIIFPDKFEKETRSVKLEGDAYFKVKPDKSRTFIVKTGELTVKVLGTSFYINAQPDQSETVVTVSSGKVSFGSGSNEIILTAGEKGVFDKGKRTFAKMVNDDDNFLSWKTRMLIFHEEKLESVFKKIEQTYNIKIQIGSPEIAECRLTATFENQSLDEVLDILKATFNLHLKKQNDLVIVSGNGCIE